MDDRKKLMRWVLVALLMVPVGLTAALGSFSRLMGVDYCNFSAAVELSAWEHILHGNEHGNSSYSHFLIHDLLSGLGPELIPSLLPSVIVVAWLFGVYCLISHALRDLQVVQNRRAVSLGLAALTIAATVKGFYAWESIYWFAASSRYMVPTVVLTIYLAAAYEISGRTPSKGRGFAAIGGSAVCL